jgi:Domain of unknown function (DUF4406)
MVLRAKPLLEQIAVKIYLAGKMRGLPNFGKDAFLKAASELRAQGHIVFNPVEETIKLYGAGVYENNPHGDESITPISGELVFFNDLTFICLHADAVYLLPGWQTSAGAAAERAVAIALGKPVVEL